MVLLIAFTVDGERTTLGNRDGASILVYGIRVIGVGGVVSTKAKLGIGGRTSGLPRREILVVRPRRKILVVRAGGGSSSSGGGSSGSKSCWEKIEPKNWIW